MYTLLCNNISNGSTIVLFRLYIYFVVCIGGLTQIKPGHPRWCPHLLLSPLVLTYCSHHLFSLFTPPVVTLLTCCHIFSPISPSHFSLSACSHSLTLSLSLTSRQSDSHLQTNTVSKYPTSTLPSLSVYLLLTPLHSTPLYGREIPVAAGGCCGVCSSSCCACRKIARSFGLGIPLIC